MKANTTSPSAQDLATLSRLVEGYPISRDELIWTAQEARLGKSLIRFLEQFPEDRVFLRPEDFTSDSEELEVLIREEAAASPEHLRSPQD